MTAEQIREMDRTLNYQNDLFRVLKEIAAQLADLNDEIYVARQEAITRG